MYYYLITRNDLHAEDTGKYQAFGIALCDESSHIICQVDDITTDEAAIKRLIELCNRLKLSPLHLSDVVDDFLLA